MELLDGDRRVDPSWWPIATGNQQELYVDRTGAVLVWSNDIDTEVAHAHPSFEAWMGELATALGSGARVHNVASIRLWNERGRNEGTGDCDRSVG